MGVGIERQYQKLKRIESEGGGNLYDCFQLEKTFRILLALYS